MVADDRPERPWICVRLVPALRTSSDPTPNLNAIAAMLRILEGGFDIKVVTERSSTLGGKKMTEEWLVAQGLPPLDVVSPIAAKAIKGAVHVDDLAFLLLLSENLSLAAY